MTLLGGMGTVFGPLVGAAIIVTMQNYLATFGAWVTVIQGVIFVVCVLLFREGDRRRPRPLAPPPALTGARPNDFERGPAKLPLRDCFPGGPPQPQGCRLTADGFGSGYLRRHRGGASERPEMDPSTEPGPTDSCG